MLQKSWEYFQILSNLKSIGLKGWVGMPGKIKIKHWANILQTTSGPWQKLEGPLILLLQHTVLSRGSEPKTKRVECMPSWVEWSLIKDIWWDLSNNSEIGTSAKTAVSLSCSFPFFPSCSLSHLVQKGRQMTPGKVWMMSMWNNTNYFREKIGCEQRWKRKEMSWELGKYIIAPPKIKIYKWRKLLILKDNKDSLIWKNI